MDTKRHHVQFLSCKHWWKPFCVVCRPIRPNVHCNAEQLDYNVNAICQTAVCHSMHRCGGNAQGAPIKLHYLLTITVRVVQKHSREGKLTESTEIETPNVYLYVYPSIVDIHIIDRMCLTLNLPVLSRIGSRHWSSNLRRDRVSRLPKPRRWVNQPRRGQNETETTSLTLLNP